MIIISTTFTDSVQCLMWDSKKSFGHKRTCKIVRKMTVKFFVSLVNLTVEDGMYLTGSILELSMISH